MSEPGFGFPVIPEEATPGWLASEMSGLGKASFYVKRSAQGWFKASFGFSVGDTESLF